MTRFRVLVADDEPLARRMVVAILKGDPDVEAVADCGDAKCVREQLGRFRPDNAMPMSAIAPISGGGYCLGSKS